MHIFFIILSAIQFNSVLFLTFGKKRVELRTKELYNNMHHMQKTAMKFK